MRYEAVIIWTTGEKETHKYKTYDEAMDAIRGYRTAFGNQIEWAGCRELKAGA